MFSEFFAPALLFSNPTRIFFFSPADKMQTVCFDTEELVDSWELKKQTRTKKICPSPHFGPDRGIPRFSLHVEFAWSVTDTMILYSIILFVFFESECKRQKNSLKVNTKRQKKRWLTSHSPIKKFRWVRGDTPRIWCEFIFLFVLCPDYRDGSILYTIWAMCVRACVGRMEARAGGYPGPPWCEKKNKHNPQENTYDRKLYIFYLFFPFSSGECALLASWQQWRIVGWPPTVLWARVWSSATVFRSWSGPHNRALERVKSSSLPG